jgi:hypothetical protein
MKKLTYHTFRIPKKSKGYRKICVAHKDLKKMLKNDLQDLYESFLKLEKEVLGSTDYIHGFIKDRNAVSGASQHIGFQTTMYFDITNFFDNINRDMLPNKILNHTNRYHFIKDGSLAQGFSTSPIIASMLSIYIAKALIDELGNEVAITLYADDLTISFNREKDYEYENSLALKVKEIIESFQLEINPKKTRTRRACYGNRRILGIMVTDTGLVQTRKIKLRKRAVKYYAEKANNENDKLHLEQVYQGLDNWSDCNMPKALR